MTNKEFYIENEFYFEGETTPSTVKIRLDSKECFGKRHELNQCDVCKLFYCDDCQWDLGDVCNSCAKIADEED